MTTHRHESQLLDPVTVRKRAGSPGMWVERAIVAIAAAIAIVAPFVISESRLLLILALMFFAGVHGVRRYGWRRFVFYFVVPAMAISLFFENLSVAVGFPFGNYHYTAGGRIGEVPSFIPMAYVGLGYVCWMVASTLLDAADKRLGDRSAPGRKLTIVALPAVAAFLMAAFDVGSDSFASTVAHSWMREDGGGVFGVPYVNFLGWWFVTYCYIQLFALLLAARPENPVGARDAGREPYGKAVVLYALLAVLSVTAFIGDPGAGLVADPAGVMWSVAGMTPWNRRPSTLASPSGARTTTPLRTPCHSASRNNAPSSIRLWSHCR